MKPALLLAAALLIGAGGFLAGQRYEKNQWHNFEFVRCKGNGNTVTVVRGDFEVEMTFPRVAPTENSSGPSFKIKRVP